MKKTLIFLLVTMIQSIYGADLVPTPSSTVGSGASTEFPESWTGSCFSPEITPTHDDVKQAEQNNQIGTNDFQHKSVQVAGETVTGKAVLQVVKDTVSAVVPRVVLGAVDQIFPNREPLGQVLALKQSEDFVSSACFRPENLPTQHEVNRAEQNGQIGTDSLLNKTVELSDGTLVPVSAIAEKAVVLAGASQHPVFGLFVQACLGNKSNKRIWSKS